MTIRTRQQWRTHSTKGGVGGGTLPVTTSSVSQVTARTITPREGGHLSTTSLKRGRTSQGHTNRSAAQNKCPKHIISETTLPVRRGRSGRTCCKRTCTRKWRRWERWGRSRGRARWVIDHRRHSTEKYKYFYAATHLLQSQQWDVGP